MCTGYCILIFGRNNCGEGNGTPLQYSCLENPMDGEAWWAAVHGVAEGRTRLRDFTFTFHFHALEKEMATHSSVLAWIIPETGEPGGLPSLGSYRVAHDWSDLAAVAEITEAQIVCLLIQFTLRYHLSLITYIQVQGLRISRSPEIWEICVKPGLWAFLFILRIYGRL